MDIEKLKDMLRNAAGGPVGIQMCQEAADALEQLQAENEKLKAQVPRWIPVEERLPEKSGEYLVLTEESDIFGMDFDEDVGENGEFGFWFPRFSQGGYVDLNWEKAENVTHWMLLPKLPKEGKKR